MYNYHIEVYDLHVDPHGKGKSRQDTVVMPVFFLDKVVIEVRMEYDYDWEKSPELYCVTIYNFRDEAYQKRSKQTTYYSRSNRNPISQIPKKYLDLIEFGKRVACTFDINASIIQQNLCGWRNKWIRYAPDGTVLKLDSNQDRVFAH